MHNKTDKKVICYYHANCADGYAAAACVHMMYPEAEFIASNYTDAGPLLMDIEDKHVYVVDFSFPMPMMEEIAIHAQKLIWLDHHKTAWEAYAESPVMQYNKTGLVPDIVLSQDISGAILAWDYFFPERQAPDLMYHIQDRDLWKFKYEDTKAIMAGFLSERNDWTLENSRYYFAADERGKSSTTDRLMKKGTVLLNVMDKYCERMLQENAIRQTWVVSPMNYKDGTSPVQEISVMVVNATEYISELGNMISERTGVITFIWYMDQTGTIKCSLRGLDTIQVDCSAVASAYGGGGHRNAAGFSLPSLHSLDNLFTCN